MSRYERSLDARRPGSGSPVVRIQLSGADRETLALVEGLGAALLHPVAPSTPPELELLATLQGAWVRAGAEGPWLYVRSPRNPTGLVTAWTLPLLGEGGLTGFDPADLGVLLASRGAEFENLPWRWKAPLQAHLAPRAADASGAFVAFAGEEFALREVQDWVEHLQELLPQAAHCLFATAVLPGHPLEVMLTLFHGGPT